MVISFILFGIYLFLIFLGRKQPDKNPFLKIAGYLVKKSPMKQINSESVKENLKILHPLKAASKQAEIYYKEKLAFVLTVVFVGNCFVFLLGVNNWQTSNLENMNKNLPVLFVSGQEDPVGDYGEGVICAKNALVKAGLENVSMKLYPGDRHEILNETDREVVYQDIYEWLDSLKQV